MRSISFSRLRHILAVARTASFSLAAEEEGISQPALSRSIQAFEAQYGVRLFDRSRGAVTLTPAGELAIQQAHATLAAVEELDRNMLLFAKGGAGRLGIGLGPLLASILLPAIGKTLLRASPLLQIVSRISPADELAEDLIEGRIEAVIGNRWHLGQIPGVKRVHLGNLPLALAVRVGHPAEVRKGLSLADLVTFPVASAVERALSPGTIQAGAFICDNFNILRETVLETDCVWLTSPVFIAEDLQEGRLRLLDVVDLDPNETDVWLATVIGKTGSPALGLLTDIARQWLASTSSAN
jgi:DNA-binding transcriptional LysR family regulator